MAEVQSKITHLNVAKIASDLATTQMRIDSGTETLKELFSKKEILGNELREQERTKKTMCDNLEYRASMVKHETLLKKIANAKYELGIKESENNLEDSSKESCATALEADQAAGERAILKAEQSKARLVQELYRAKGRMESVQEQIRHLADKLSGPHLLDIDKRYRKAFIQHETVELATRDLEAYHQALDKALQVG